MNDENGYQATFTSFMRASGGQISAQSDSLSRASVLLAVVQLEQENVTPLVTPQRLPHPTNGIMDPYGSLMVLDRQCPSTARGKTDRKDHEILAIEDPDRTVRKASIGRFECGFHDGHGHTLSVATETIHDVQKLFGN